MALLSLKRQMTVEEIRTSLRYYPPGKEKIPAFLLKSLALTLEVFLHRRIGERVLSWPKTIMGIVWIWALAHVFVPWNWEASGKIYWPFQIPHAQWVEIGTLWLIPISIPTFTKAVDGLPVLEIVISCYFAAASIQSIILFLYNRFGDAPHANSSGEPYPLWDPAYRVFHALNFRTDLVKQICEPAICSLLGVYIFWTTHKEMESLSVWLILASVGLFIKAVLENRKRKDLFLDKLAGQMDAEALRLQLLSLEEAADDEFDQVPTFFRR